MDCLEGMKEFPDKYFDLAVVDPPYGNGNQDYDASTERYGGRFSKYFERDGKNVERTGGTWSTKYGKNICRWDVTPPQEYFDELFRVSKNQIIWGGNYFTLPATRCFLVWKKLTISENFTMAMAEYAWTSFNDNAKVFEYAPQDKGRFHPTQKPVALYEWILNRYAKAGDIILDTHVGSGSSLVACRNTNHRYVGFEIDETYYQKAKERIEREIAQMNLFDFLEKGET